MQTANFSDVFAAGLGREMVGVGEDYFAADGFELGAGYAFDGSFCGYGHVDRCVDLAVGKS